MVKTPSARAVLISLFISGFTEACRKGGCFSIQFLKVTSFNLGVTSLIFTIIQHVKLVKLPLKESGGRASAPPSMLRQPKARVGRLRQPELEK